MAGSADRRIRNGRKSRGHTALLGATGTTAAREHVGHRDHRQPRRLTSDIAGRYTELMDDLARRYLGTDVYPMRNRGSATAVIVRTTPRRVGGLEPWAEPAR